MTKMPDGAATKSLCHYCRFKNILVGTTSDDFSKVRQEKQYCEQAQSVQREVSAPCPHLCPDSR